MKKLLIGTSALVALVAGSANAAEPIKLSVGGYGVGYVAYSSQRDSYLKGGSGATSSTVGTSIESNGVDVKGDNEVHFKGKTTLDNGITVSVKYEFEAGGADQGNINDEWNIAASGVFGTIQLAADDTATDSLAIGSNDYGLKILGGAFDNDVTGALVLKPAGMATTTVTTVKPIERDAESVSYFTPAFMGFTAGASYHPSSAYKTKDISNDNGAPASNNTVGDASDDAYTMGLQWKGEFSGVKLGAMAGYGVMDPTQGAAEKNHDEWGAGAQIGYAGFSFGGKYRKINIDATDINVSAAKRRDLDKATWEIGAGYQTGAYAVALNYEAGSAKNSAVAESDDKFWQLQLSGQYTMGPGVALEAAVAYADMKNGTVSTATSEVKDANHNAGWVVGTGLSLKF